MVFWLYVPAIKIAAIWMLLDRQSQNSIWNSPGNSFSRQSFNNWIDIFKHMKCVVQDPETHATQGQIVTFTTEEIYFILELVQTELGILLRNMFEFLYESNWTLLSCWVFAQKGLKLCRSNGLSQVISVVPVCLNLAWTLFVHVITG